MGGITYEVRGKMRGCMVVGLAKDGTFDGCKILGLGDAVVGRVIVTRGKIMSFCRV